MAVHIRKLGDNQYELAGNGHSLTIDQDLFEDIYFAIPEGAGEYKNETEFFRQLTDNIAQNQTERDTINAMLAGEADRIAAIRSLQDQVRAIGV